MQKVVSLGHGSCLLYEDKGGKVAVLGNMVNRGKLYIYNKKCGQIEMRLMKVIQMRMYTHTNGQE